MSTILTYHHVDRPDVDASDANLFVTPEAFQAQMNSLRSRGYEAVSLDRLHAALTGGECLSARSVVITFDDGYLDNYAHAFPILRELEMTATFFIVTGQIGGKDEQGHAHMNSNHLREMQDAGMSFGSHSSRHLWLARQPLEEARRDLVESKAALEEILGEPVRWLCYPSGSFNHEVAEAAREIGYRGACSAIRDNRASVGQLFHLPRVMVMHDTSLRRFRYHFSPLYHWLHARKNRRRWKDHL
jgi:peptidoglycan/xylan/chitin deacetylase (PgdA/CDA1 family)